MNKIIYVGAVVILSVVFALYTPKMIASANDKIEQRQVNKQIMDLQLQLEDVQSEWSILDDQKKELEQGIKDITEQQYSLHREAEIIRNQIKQLKGEKTLNETMMNCYEFEGELYNDCLDAVISTQTGGL